MTVKLTVVGMLALWTVAFSARPVPLPSASRERPRVLITSDIGGTDPDDFQSMIHFLLYADDFDVDGIVSSPYGL